MSESIALKPNYAETVSQALKKRRLKFTETKTETGKKLRIPMPVKNAPDLKVFLYVDTDGDCSFRAYLPYGISSTRETAIHAALNQLNARFRFVYLHMDEDGDIRFGYDIVLTAPEEALPTYMMQLLSLFTSIIDQCIPEIKSAMNEASHQPEEDFFIRTKLFEED